jgi:hypothetical protein
MGCIHRTIHSAKSLCALPRPARPIGGRHNEKLEDVDADSLLPWGNLIVSFKCGLSYFGISCFATRPCMHANNLICQQMSPDYGEHQARSLLGVLP